jgi:hypothetical protein
MSNSDTSNYAWENVYGAIGTHNIAKEGTNWEVLRVEYICKFGG